MSQTWRQSAPIGDGSQALKALTRGVAGLCGFTLALLSLCAPYPSRAADDTPPPIETPAYPDASDPAALGRWFALTTHLSARSIMAITDNAIFAIFAQRSHKGLALVDLHEEVISPDFAEAAGGRSLHIRLQINCVKRQVRLMALDLYAGANLTGDSVHRAPENDWTAPSPGTYVSDALHAACDADYKSPFAAVAVAQTDTPAQAKVRIVKTPSAPPSGTTAVAQVGAFSGADSAASTWRAIRNAFPTQTEPLTFTAIPVTAGGRSFFRAVVSGFAKAGDAGAFCAQLQKANFKCLPVGPQKSAAAARPKR